MVPAGGAGPSETGTIKQLARKIAEKKDESYSDALLYVRTKINFALLRGAVICLRGCRGSDIDSSCSALVQDGKLVS